MVFRNVFVEHIFVVISSDSAVCIMCSHGRFCGVLSRELNRCNGTLFNRLSYSRAAITSGFERGQLFGCLLSLLSLHFFNGFSNAFEYLINDLDLNSSHPFSWSVLLPWAFRAWSLAGLVFLVCYHHLLSYRSRPPSPSAETAPCPHTRTHPRH